MKAFKHPHLCHITFNFHIVLYFTDRPSLHSSLPCVRTPPISAPCRPRPHCTVDCSVVYCTVVLHITLQYSDALLVQYSTVCTVQCSAVQNSAVQFSKDQCSELQYRTVHIITSCPYLAALMKQPFLLWLMNSVRNSVKILEQFSVQLLCGLLYTVVYSVVCSKVCSFVCSFNSSFIECSILSVLSLV